MPKLNAVLMVLLTLATIAGAGVLVLRKTPPPTEDPAAAQKLLRKLADSDPDVRREAETGLKALGPRALEPLRDAAKSSDKVLADRASKLVRELSGQAATTAAAKDAAPADVEAPVEFALECPKPRVRPVDGRIDLRLYVRLINRGSFPLLLARDEVLRYGRFAHFEVATGEGLWKSVLPDPADVEKLEVVVVQPGETIDLGLVQGDACRLVAASLGAPGSYRIRFVYDAAEGSLYRKLVPPSPRGALLPPARLVSAPVTIDVTE